MNKRLKKLETELTQKVSRETYINSESIKKRVNGMLDAIPSERSNYMRQKLIKSVVMALIAAAAMGTTGFAMSNIDLLRQYFIGETEKIENYVETPKTKVSDENFEVTLEKAITTKYNVKAVISVKALNKEAKKQMSDEKLNVIRDTYVNYTDCHDSHYISSWVGKELKEYRAADTVFWEISVDSNNSEKDGEMIKMTFDFLNSENNSIVFELKTNMETYEYNLGGQPYTNAELKLSQIGAILIKGIPADENPEMEMTNAYFRMQDGSIKTYNQIFDVYGLSLAQEGKDYNMYKYVGDAYEVLDLTEFKSVIVDGIEYELENPETHKLADENELIMPFECRVRYYGENAYISLDSLVDGLGGERTEDGLIYHDEAYEIADDTTVIIDGEKYIRAYSAGEILRFKTFIKDSDVPIHERELIIVP
ncbi:hypothetical protein IMSAG049_00854 [Clostridiales bacterium]|nr:hypothetical protein IMSAG049_00854 [Clostridiales bacterium]